MTTGRQPKGNLSGHGKKCSWKVPNYKNKTKRKEERKLKHTKIKLHQTVSRPVTAVLGHENPLRTIDDQVLQAIANNQGS